MGPVLVVGGSGLNKGEGGLKVRGRPAWTGWERPDSRGPCRLGREGRPWWATGGKTGPVGPSQLDQA